MTPPRSKSKDKAIASPTKQFFVSMLTRDISLDDAILDLVDNCLDGAMRIAPDEKVDYSKHSILITFSKESFVIQDDCGGIPRNIAKNYAFKMGRDLGDDRDSDTETIGMYGIGMKRAMFKMGNDALVRSLHDKDGFEVAITPDWLASPKWDSLPIESTSRSKKLDSPGTRIEVQGLFPGVSRQFSLKGFKEDLHQALGEHFTLFLQAGLVIKVNGKKVRPIRVEVLVSTKDDGPAPYVFQKEIEDVLVSIVVGLNTGRGLADDDEPDFERNRSSTTAGWSVFCNDRAVIVGDKGRLTGWGDGVPMYHDQFSVITGIVRFRSNSAERLPVTTTKRALDTSSNIWLEARTKMREGLKVWISHTNAWKNHPRSKQARYWDSTEPLPLEQAIERVLKRSFTSGKDGSVVYNPQKKNVLPNPKSKTPSSRRIVFSKPKGEIEELSLSLFDRSDEEPGVVGDQCFTLVLQKVRGAGKTK